MLLELAVVVVLRVAKDKVRDMAHRDLAETRTDVDRNVRIQAGANIHHVLEIIVRHNALDSVPRAEDIEVGRKHLVQHFRTGALPVHNEVDKAGAINKGGTPSGHIGKRHGAVGFKVNRVASMKQHVAQDLHPRDIFGEERFAASDCHVANEVPGELRDFAERFFRFQFKEGTIVKTGVDCGVPAFGRIARICTAQITPIGAEENGRAPCVVGFAINGPEDVDDFEFGHFYPFPVKI